VRFRLLIPLVLGVIATALGAPRPALAQQAAAVPNPLLEVGTVAPDFALPAHALRPAPAAVRLSDYRGTAVVLAFFYRVRSPG